MSNHAQHHGPSTADRSEGRLRRIHTLTASAVLACACSTLLATAQATTYCAHTSAELNTALQAVSTDGAANGQDNIIRLVNGTYATSGSTFTFNSVSGYSLIIDGGYDGACATQDPTPDLSVLDGGGIAEVLSMQTNGAVTLRHVTVQNGFRDGSSNGGGVGVFLNQVQAGDPIPAATFDADIFRDNSSNYASGALTIFVPSPDPETHAGVVTIQNSLFVGNSAPSAGAMFVDLGPGSSIYLTNDTIVSNTCTKAGCSITSIGDASGAPNGFVSNTISYGNTATHDFFLYFNGSVEFTNDDYGSLDGTPSASSSANLVDVDPQFVAADDFHLRSTSPLLRAGTPAPPGGLAVSDLEGNPRSIALVDVGAYENVDFIFASGFETP